MDAVRGQMLPDFQKVRHVGSGCWMPVWVAHKWQGGQLDFLPENWKLSMSPVASQQKNLMHVIIMKLCGVLNSVCNPPSTC